MQGTILVATAGQGVLRSNDDGATWNRIPLDQDLESTPWCARSPSIQPVPR